MQANKSRRASEPPHRISSATIRPNGLSLAAIAYAGINQPKKIASYKSQNENEQSVGRHSVLEKKRLEELQEELRRTMDQLASSESCRKRAQQEAEEARMQLFVMSSKFEESQCQLAELSAAEDDRIHELRKISQERDKAWQSELAALQNQQSIDMAAWSSAIKERQKLKSEIEVFVRSEAAMTKQLEIANYELHILKEEILEKNSATERLIIEVEECKRVEARECESFNKTRLQLEKSQARVNELEDLVKKLQENQPTSFEQNGRALLPLSCPPPRLECELKETKTEISELKSKLANRDADIRSLSDMNTKLNDQIRAQVNQVEAEFRLKIAQAAVSVSELKAGLVEKDAAIESLTRENNLLRVELGKKDTEGIKICEFEMEAELRRVKVHSNQWRKAAETAAAIVMAGSNRRVVDRSGSLCSEYFDDESNNLVHSPNMDEIGSDLTKSKNHNVLAMISGFWRKS